MKANRRAAPGHTLRELNQQPVDEADPAWLELPNGKKEIARARAKVLDDYLALERRGADDALRASEKLGVNRAMFFRLLKRWREERALTVLVPHARTTRRKSGGKKEHASDAAAIVSQVIRTTRERSPAKIVAEVLKMSSTTDLDPPRETIGELVSSELARPAYGFALIAKPGPGDAVETARRYGEVLVIDHTAAKDLFVMRGKELVRPTLTLAIDLFTTAVVGLHVSLDPPGPAQILAALADAVRSTSASRTKGEAIRPRLMMNVDWGPAWRDLQVDLEAGSAGLIVRRTPRFTYGTPALRLIGRRMGRLILVPRKSHDRDLGRDEFDSERHAPMTLEEATEVARGNALIHAADLLVGVDLSAIDLSLPPTGI